MPSPFTMAIGFTLACADQEKIVWRLVSATISAAVIVSVVSVVVIWGSSEGERLIQVADHRSQTTGEWPRSRSHRAKSRSYVWIPPASPSVWLAIRTRIGSGCDYRLTETECSPLVYSARAAFRGIES